MRIDLGIGTLGEDQIEISHAGARDDALFGFVEVQPSGPYGLNSPPAYIFASEDPGQITANNIVGSGSFSSGTISPVRDVSGTSGLMSGPTGFSFTVNADGTLTGTGTTGGSGSFAGATNSTSASPGKVLFIPNNAVAGIRLLEP